MRVMLWQGNCCVMTNTNELRACCPHNRETLGASRTTGYFWKQSCGLPEAARRGATCRRNSAHGTPCTSGSGDGRRKASDKRCLPSLPKMPILRKPSSTAPSSKPTSMLPVLQKKRRASAWPLARRTDHKDSCAGRGFGADGAVDADRRPDARLPASRSLARRASTGCRGRGQSLRCRRFDRAYSGDGCFRRHSAARKPARTAVKQRATLSRLVVETASNSFHLGM